MIPSAFVMLEELPLTAPAAKWTGAAGPGLIEGRAGGRYVAPRNAVEELLAGIWQEVLKVEAVSIGENFFELGAIRC
nr:hypothetical protein [uncultured bacterium]